ncbi:class I SAM-dependent methyltransferase [Flavivirga aquimarina]|uniref:Class I SAM-dependent methyltransferase n=1 Tax=Flavivirga aquimarina TaxID=2027862 RepID=A0ABT8WG79_9FLAO|nr:class I SAM-dependent methyltransferase [Flavivirga aquimarina]MDO5972154.1 class I SAM-dependent methyltransferase [Flavivirga aquimarina]
MTNKLKYLIKTKFTLKELKKNSDNDIRIMGSVIDFIISDNSWTEEEKAALNEVDKLEKKYLKSSETIENVDYGAGSSNSKKSQQNIKEGNITIQKVSDIHKIASSNKKWGKLIFKIIRAHKPTNCLELGTSLGVSAAYQILALKLNHNGNLTTIEGSKERAKIANESLKNLQYKDYKVVNGKFYDILPEVLDKNELIDLVFIDGHHDETATQKYFELLYPFLSDKSILIFDDINWSNGMKSVWKNIYKDNRINVSFDLYQWGICLVNKDKKKMEENHFNLRI